MHDVIIVAVPLIAILAGILFNRADIKDLRNEIKDLRGEQNNLRNELKSEMREGFKNIHADIAVLQSEMRQFYHLTAS